MIDDDEIYQVIIGKLIKKAAVFEEQHYFQCANMVLSMLESEEIYLPDVILLDINMPQMDGWQFIEELKRLYSDLEHRTQIYIVSSSIAYSDKERINEFPVVEGFVSKPISIKKLREIGEGIKKTNPVNEPGVNEFL